MDILTRLDACAECEQAPLAPLLADAAYEIRMLRKDAARYEWLRRREAGDQWRYMGGVSGEKMDAHIDAAIREEGANA